MTQVVNAADARNNFSDLINQAFYNRRTYLINKMGKPCAVIVGFEQFQQYEKLRRLLFSQIDEIAHKNKSIPLSKVVKDITSARKGI